MEIISNLQKRILEEFSRISENEYFYLTGGTALAEFYLLRSGRKRLPVSLDPELNQQIRITAMRKYQTVILTVPLHDVGRLVSSLEY